MTNAHLAPAAVVSPEQAAHVGSRPWGFAERGVLWSRDGTSTICVRHAGEQQTPLMVRLMARWSDLSERERAVVHEMASAKGA
jgi:hypothetical protein